MKSGNIVWVETSRYLTKITTLRRKADRKSARSKVLAAKHTASLQLLCTVGPAYRREIYLFLWGGVEAGHACSCTTLRLSLRVAKFLALFVYASLSSQSRGSIPYMTWCWSSWLVRLRRGRGAGASLTLWILRWTAATWLGSLYIEYLVV